MSARRPSLSGSRRLAAVFVLALVASLALAGCGAKDKAPDKAADPLGTEGGTQLAAVWPLTGLPVTGSTPKHPVMIVKIDNSFQSKPQVGLGKADMVVQELVEGGITRLAAMFYTHLAPVAGPVRSARASDIGVVTPTHAVLIASGMAPPTKGRLNAAGVTYYEMGAPGVARDNNDPNHDSLHSVFVKLPVLAASIKKAPVVPAAYLPWGAESDFTGAAPATSISSSFTGGASATKFVYKAKSKTYENTNSFAGSGDEFKPSSLLVLRVREGNAGYLDPAGNTVPETLFYGKGTLALFHDGQIVRGTWSKAKRSSPLVLTTAAGPLKVPAGHVWIQLLPRDKDGGKLSFER
ncbi:MAG: hypothetical protein JWQ74_571 [Marmoricola sp.]|nr:hypothetical protein [Marmoricola sp.]